MRNTSNNWISSDEDRPISSIDMIKELLARPYRLVLVQQHELERLRVDTSRTKHNDYISRLFNHYIINQGSKTYLKE
jgi:hypothetical protein